MTANQQPSADYLSLIDSLQPFYVFGFGSLMWCPDFDYQEKFFGRVWGYHRRFGLWSFHYRGTRQNPGLVLGLDSGASSIGLCFRVAPADKKSVAEKLWHREMVSYAYAPEIVSVATTINNILCVVKALAFTLNPNHEQYVKPITPIHQQARIIATSSGLSGPNRDYFLNMVSTLQQMNIRDHYIDELKSAYDALTS